MSDLSPIPLQKVKKQFQAYLDSPSNTTDINENYPIHGNNSLNTSPLKPLPALSPVKYFSKNPSPLKEEEKSGHISTYQNENVCSENLFANKYNNNSSSSPNVSCDFTAENLSPVKIQNNSNIDGKQMELNLEFNFLKSKGFSKKLTNSVISDLYQRAEKFSSGGSFEDSNTDSAINNKAKKSKDPNLPENEIKYAFDSMQPSSVISSIYDKKIQSKFDNIHNKDFQRMESIETHYLAERTKTLSNREIKTPSSVIKSLASPSKNLIELSKRKNIQQDTSMMDVDETSIVNNSKKSSNKRQSVVMSEILTFDPVSESAASITTTTKKRRTLVGPMPVTIPLNDVDNNNVSTKHDLKHLDLTVDMSMLTKFDDQQIQSDIDLSSSADISMTNNKNKDSESHPILQPANILDLLSAQNNRTTIKTNSNPKLVSKQLYELPRSSDSSNSMGLLRSGSNLIKATKKSQILALMKKAPKNNDIIMTDSKMLDTHAGGRVPSIASSVNTNNSLFSNDNDHLALNNNANSRKFSNATTVSSILSSSHHSRHSVSIKDNHKVVEDDRLFLKPLLRPLFRPNSSLATMKQFQGTQGTLKSQMRKQNSASNLNSTDSDNQKYKIKPLTPRNVTKSKDDKNLNSDMKVPSFLKPTAASLSRQSSKNSISSTSSTSSLSRNKFNSSKQISFSPSSSSTAKETKGSVSTIKTSTSSNVAVLSTSASLNSVSGNAKKGIQRTESGKLLQPLYSRIRISDKNENLTSKESKSKKKWGLYGNYFQK